MIYLLQNNGFARILSNTFGNGDIPRKTEDIISALSLNKENKYSLIELGAGDGTKTVHLLRTLVNKNINLSTFQ